MKGMHLSTCDLALDFWEYQNPFEPMMNEDAQETTIADSIVLCPCVSSDWNGMEMENIII